MHSAPPVLVPVGRSLWGGRLPLLASGLMAVSVCLLAWHAGLALSGLLVLMAVCTLCLWLVWQWAPRERLPEGELAWDGEAWWFCGHGGARQAVDVELQWDAGRAMLLRVSAIPRHGWLDRYTWLQASRLPLQWHGLRCAVHATHTF